jgi:glycosyltransferase involved in cell wall biosynthesis
MRYSPGHYSHLLAIAHGLAVEGYSVECFLANGYSELGFSGKKRGLLRIILDYAFAKKDLSVIYSPSVFNIIAVLFAKLRFDGAKIIYVYHEPLDVVNGLKNESLIGFSKCIIASVITWPVLMMSDYVWLPSEVGKTNYCTFEKVFCSNIYMRYLPLLNEDANTIKGVEYSIGYIGTVSKAHDFEGYLIFVIYLLQNTRDERAIIATKSNISELLLKYKLSKYIQSGRLTVLQGRPLQTIEINCAYEKCNCVWMCYNRSTQSGVLAKCMMLGVPVIYTKYSIFDKQLNHNLEGIRLEEKSCDEILQAINEVRRRREVMGENCKKYFRKVYDASQGLGINNAIYKPDYSQS